MRFVRRFTDLLVYTNLFTACCAAGLCMATERLIQKQLPHIFSPLHLLVLGSTLVVYNAVPVMRRKRYVSGPYFELKNWHLAFFISGGVLTCISAAFLKPVVFGVCGVLALLAFGYTWPLLPAGGRRRLREFGGLKTVVLAGVWTTATAILPLLENGKNIWEYPLEVLIRLSLIFSLCVIFDIRDMQTDLKNNIQTLPNRFGVVTSRRLVTLGFICFVLFSVFQYMRHPDAARLAGAFITASVGQGLLTFLVKSAGERTFVLLADGVMLLYTLLVLLLPVV